VRQRRPRNAEQHFRDALACAPHDAAALDGLRTLMQDRKRATNVLRFASRQESGHPQAHEIASRFAGAPTALLAIVFVATIILVPRAGGSVGEAAAAGFAVLLLFVLVVLRLRYLPTGRLGGDAGRRRVRLLWFLGSIGVVVSVLFAAYFAAIGLSDLIGADDHAAEDVLLLAYAAALMWLAIWFVSRMRRIADA
jgi:hypothetical protein